MNTCAKKCIIDAATLAAIAQARAEAAADRAEEAAERAAQGGKVMIDVQTLTTQATAADSYTYDSTQNIFTFDLGGKSSFIRILAIEPGLQEVRIVVANGSDGDLIRMLVHKPMDSRLVILDSEGNTITDVSAGVPTADYLFTLLYSKNTLTGISSFIAAN